MEEQHLVGSMLYVKRSSSVAQSIFVVCLNKFFDSLWALQNEMVSPLHLYNSLWQILLVQGNSITGETDCL
jgi:hypothetical protein